MLVTGNYNKKDFQNFILSYMSTDEEYSHASVKFDLSRIKRQVNLSNVNIVLINTILIMLKDIGAVHKRQIHVHNKQFQAGVPVQSGY